MLRSEGRHEAKLVKKLVASLAILVILVAGAIGSMKYHARQVAEQAKAEHNAALANSDEITHGIKNYWELKHRTIGLENDKIRLKNDLLDYEIAGLEGRPQDKSRSRIRRDAAVIKSDEEALRTLSPNDVLMLNPHQAEERVRAHNQKYAHDQIADLADINNEAEEVNAKIQPAIPIVEKLLCQSSRFG
jgi:hypothetical protein